MRKTFEFHVNAGPHEIPTNLARAPNAGLVESTLVHTRWKISAIIATIGAVVVVAGCSSNHSPSSAPSSGSARGGGGGLKTVSNCLSSHGADPSSLNGLLSGTPITATASQLAALRTASTQCESAVPAKLRRGLSSTVTCLDRHGYHLDSNAPLSALFSLDLSKSAVATAVTTCSTALSRGPSTSAGS